MLVIVVDVVLLRWYYNVVFRRVGVRLIVIYRSFFVVCGWYEILNMRGFLSMFMILL